MFCRYLGNGGLLVGLTYLFAQCYANNECYMVKASGFKLQKGLEGMYRRDKRCENLGQTAMYTQTEPAVGWGSNFYLYYLSEPGNYEGWVFSLYPCSDVAFARSRGINHAVSPELVDGPWEEYVSDDFTVNHDIHVKCTDGPSTGMIVAFTLIGILSLLSIIGTVLLWVRFGKKKQSQRQRRQNNHQYPQTVSQSQYNPNETIPPELCFPTTPPPYSEVITDPYSAPPEYDYIRDCIPSNTTSTLDTGNSTNYQRLQEDCCPIENSGPSAGLSHGQNVYSNPALQGGNESSDTYDTVNVGSFVEVEQNTCNRTMEQAQAQLPPPSYGEVMRDMRH